MSEKLNIVDEQGNIIGEASREQIHREGLLHREIHIWFVTPELEIIFQRRADDKDTFPSLLDATVGGHVDLGESFETAAVRETKEESGLSIALGELAPIRTTHTKSHDAVTGMTNHALRKVFRYIYIDDIAKLAVEEGIATGFEAWPLEKLTNISEDDAKKFIPSMLSDDMLNFYQQLFDS
ncbi:MAG: NUDIX domain-containing protein [Gammaproteobacteria bacterium]|nr:NUDIX domain-containing protein [Gammaproteobacteria bacterium]